MARKRGPHPKPVAQLRLQGTFDPGRHAAREAAEPHPEGEISPVPPDWLSETGRRVWTATLPFLLRGVVGASDYQVLAAFCNQAAVHSQAVRAQATLDAGKDLPFLTRAKDGNPIVSPYLRLARQSAMSMMTLGGELGLTPTARARIGALAFAPDAPPHPPGEDPWASFQVIAGGKQR